ncbi:unnamed protein product [Mesocestoides corti]|uniref:PH domain-containing protein n=1 Tax=Mesocestoides corti TaxID=53468 RepID=A0A0R3UI08_MESCO|nr:unnamed protein product [Mesocestoides corti]
MKSFSIRWLFVQKTDDFIDESNLEHANWIDSRDDTQTTGVCDLWLHDRDHSLMSSDIILESDSDLLKQIWCQRVREAAGGYSDSVCPASE